MKFNDAELLAAIDSEEQLALDAHGTLAADREEALARYKGAPTGDEQPGRSQVVDMSIADTIEWIMPSLMRIYTGGEEIGRFDARGPEDEQAAEQETKVCNWYLESRNDSYTQIHAALKDVLLLRNGYILAQWRTESSVMVEKYQGLADEEAALLAEDKEVEVVEHTEYLDPVMGRCHNIKVERKRPMEYVAIESIPPDELLVSRRHRWTSLADADFVQWRHRTTIGELRAQGFKVDDEEPGDDDTTSEYITRDRFEINTSVTDDTADPSRRLVTLKDTYIRIDLKGKGQQQLWRVCHISGSSSILLKEEADVIPIAGFAGIIYPHSHVGMSVFDLVNDLALIKQTLKRQLLDNVYLANNTQTVVDVNRVNVDDWLLSRPGGLKRVEGPVGDAFAQLVTPDVMGNILGAIEFIDAEKESRTGVTKYSAGLDANSLNKTATGVQQIQAAANQRIELIARTLATGFRDLFLIVHALVCKHSTQPLQIKLDNEWVTINPREWTRRTDFAVSVGLGTGTPEQQVQKLMMVAPLLQQGRALGLVGAQEMYNWGVEVLKAMGYRSTQKFLKPPQIDPQTGKAQEPPPQPPEAVLVEQERQKGAGMLAQAKAQADGQLEQMRAMVKQKELELQAMLKKAEQEGALALQQSNDMRQSALDQQQAEMDARFKQMELETKVQIANIQAATSVEVARIGAGVDDGTAVVQRQLVEAGYAPIAEMLLKVHEAVTAEKEIVRGPDGRVSGVRPKAVLQ